MINNKNRWLLIIGAVQTMLMAGYHFFIPHQFNWGNFLSASSPTINWSLYSINDSFSFNLLIVSFFMLLLLVKRKEQVYTIRTLAAILLLFWIFIAVYQFISPMPLPAHLLWLGLVLPGVAVINTVFLYYLFGA